MTINFHVYLNLIFRSKHNGTNILTQLTDNRLYHQRNHKLRTKILLQSLTLSTKENFVPPPSLKPLSEQIILEQNRLTQSCKSPAVGVQETPANDPSSASLRSEPSSSAAGIKIRISLHYR
ncbi:hypothetical protein CEXT_507901 [Caerostris extrusa]|uniref:Uncharacterized protein n=1 Tax=Caerostris extrusa TaxID=172846 RepID=A0AAV4XAK7_CAEEX|nr:hypothetical protein CEXT_507901 [Caerostris extrusa]